MAATLRSDWDWKVAPDAEAACAARGWHSAAEVLADNAVSVVRRVGTRDNCRLMLDRQGVRLAYLKRHWERKPRVPSGVAEAQAARWCADAGVPTLQVAASGAARLPDGQIGSVFVSWQAPGLPADEAWVADPDPTLLDALADTAGKFHGAGLFHRDFYWCHFFAHRGPAGWEVRLIDLQRVLRRPWDAWRWLAKDLGQFWKSAPTGVSPALKARWFARYRAAGGFLTPAPALAVLATGRAAFYRWKDGAA